MLTIENLVLGLPLKFRKEKFCVKDDQGENILFEGVGSILLNSDIALMNVYRMTVRPHMIEILAYPTLRDFKVMSSHKGSCVYENLVGSMIQVFNKEDAIKKYKDAIKTCPYCGAPVEFTDKWIFIAKEGGFKKMEKTEYEFFVDDYKKFVKIVNEMQGVFVYYGNNFTRRDRRFNVYFDGTSSRIILNIPGYFIKAVNRIRKGYKISCTD